MPSWHIFGSLYRTLRYFRRAASSLQSPLLLLVRLYWGWQFAQSGWGRLHHIPQATQFFASLHIPFPEANVIFVPSLEFVGGILLILGLASRVIGLLLSIDMMVAYLSSDMEALRSDLLGSGQVLQCRSLHLPLSPRC